MQLTTKRAVPIVTCDGTGVVSHAGTVLLAELADRIGLATGLSEATDGLRERRAGHDPGRVLVDVAVAIADGAVTISDVQALADQQGLHGPVGSVASTPTIWRVLAAVANTPGMLAKIRQARAEARDRAWLARGELTGSELPGSRAAGTTIAPVVGRLVAWCRARSRWRTAPQTTPSTSRYSAGCATTPAQAWCRVALVCRPGRHAGHGPLGQGRCAGQFQGRLWLPPARGVAGQHQRGPRRAAATRQRRQQHRR